MIEVIKIYHLCETDFFGERLGAVVGGGDFFFELLPMGNVQAIYWRVPVELVEAIECFDEFGAICGSVAPIPILDGAIVVCQVPKGNAVLGVEH